MTEYAVVIRHAGYWRGVIHRWSTVYPYVGEATLSGTTAVDAVKALDDDLCYATAANEGTIYRADLYDLHDKGMPIETHTYADWEAPTTWIAYSRACWPTTLTDRPDPVLENAAQLYWSAGLGHTGKPVYFRKWIHAIPQSEATVGVPDIPSATQDLIIVAQDGLKTALLGHGLVMGNARRIAGDSNVNPYYGNHQIPKGRKRKVA